MEIILDYLSQYNNMLNLNRHLKVLESQCRNLFFVLLLVCGQAVTASGQGTSTKITGTVVDEVGNPFPFVDVYVTGTTVGTVTDAKGKYEISVGSSAKTLSFNFLGYRTEVVSIGKRTSINVTLEPETSQIEETVILAFSEQKKSSLTSAVSTVRSDDIVKAPVANITNAVAGRIPGLVSMQSSGQPGQDESTLYVRGAATWNNAEPLYVIDGVERDATHFYRMDPSEIESFSILKDAASTAVYGSKGANGVVLITSKRGSEGKPSINLTSSVTLSQPTRYPHYLDSYESLVLYNEALQNDGMEKLYTDDELQHYLTGDDPYRYPNVDWYDVMMRDLSTMTNSSLSIRGGTKTVKYFFSGTYMYQDGQLITAQGRVYDPKFGYQRYTFRSNIDVIMTNEFTVSLDMSGGFTDQDQPKENTSIFTGMNRIPPYIMPALNPDGSFTGTTDYQSDNPLYLLMTRGTQRTKQNTIDTSVKLAYDFSKLIKNLRFTARLAYDSNFGSYGTWTETQSTYHLISQPGRNDRYESFLTPTYFSSGSGSTESTRKTYGEANLSWRGQWKSHSLNANAIANISEYLTGSADPYRSVSFIGRAGYSYKDRYFIEFNGAYRGSENFAPGRRFGFFPSFSAAWNLHNEPFIKNNVPAISNFKIRASYGLVGNDYAGTRFIYMADKWETNTSSYAAFGSGGGSYNGGSFEPKIANVLATWETAKQTNIGIDASFFSGRVNLTVDRFYEDRTGILMSPRSIPMVIGIGVTDMNIGQTERDGWEFDLGLNKKLTKDLSVFLKGNFTTIHNEVIEKDEAESTLKWQKEEGLPIGQQFGYVVLGFFKDQDEIDCSPVQQVGGIPIPGDLKYLDYNGDGYVNENDRLAIGYPRIPQMTYGFTGGLNYKNFGLDVHFQGTAHSSVFISNYLMYEFYNRGRVQDIHQQRWTAETAETATYPALHVGGVSQNHVKNTFFLKDNPFLRLKNVELSYQFKFKPTSAVKGLRVHLNGNNLFTWDKLKVVDPETPTGSTGAVYPQTRGYSAGISMSF